MGERCQLWIVQVCRLCVSMAVMALPVSVILMLSARSHLHLSAWHPHIFCLLQFYSVIFIFIHSVLVNLPAHAQVAAAMSWVFSDDFWRV